MRICDKCVHANACYDKNMNEMCTCDYFIEAENQSIYKEGAFYLVEE